MLGLFAIASGEGAFAQTPAATTTTLSVTSGGSAATSITVGDLVTLTATLTGLPSSATGQVNFCDASAALCASNHLLGTAQVTSAGTATFKLHPGIGSHSYKAVFVGTKSYAASASSSSASLTVAPRNGPITSTTTTIAQAGTTGNFTLTSTVTSGAPLLLSSGGKAPITGSVSFLDTSNSNNVLATAPLVSNSSLNWQVLASVGTSASNPRIVVGDFNGDGISDTATFNLPVSVGTSNVAIDVELGSIFGNTSAAPGITVATSQAAGSGIVVGDFNSDGKLDIAISVLNTAFSPTPGSIHIFLGNGDGSFSPVTATATIGAIATIMGAADFDGDGKLDLAVNENGNVRILLGNGDGTFNQGPASGVATSSANPVLAIGDLNHDGVPDLIVATNNSAVQGYLSHRDGTFTAAGQPITIASATRVLVGVVGDFNQDGILDISIADGSSNLVTVLPGVGDGTFGQAIVTANPSGISITGLESMAGADLNQDGKLDLVITNASGQQLNPALPPITVLLGIGDGTFAPPIYNSQIAAIGQVATGDFDTDGVPDLALGASSGLQLEQTQFIQIATATATGISPSGSSPHNVAASYPGDSNYRSSFSTTTPLGLLLAAPVFTLASGTYSGLVSIPITDASPGATINYFASGSAVLALGGTYNGPIPVYSSGTVTIQAFATESGYQQSAVTTATYTITLTPAPAPVISLAGGYYAGTQTVSITSSNPTIPIFYTTNGATPSQYTNLYTGPITVSNSETLAAVAVGNGFSASPVVSAQYFLGSNAVAPYIYTVAGTDSFGYAGDGGPANLASLNNPGFALMDGAGNLYIADASNSVIRKVAASTGIITTIAGNGSSGFSGDNGPATAAQLNYPDGLAIDASGNLYIADSENNLIRKVTATTGIITTYAGNVSYVGSPTSTDAGDGGPATTAQLAAPRGLAVDSAGNLYISSAFEIRKVNPSTGIITAVAGGGPIINGNTLGDGGPAINAQLVGSGQIALDNASNIYIADPFNNSIRKVTASTGIISTVAGVHYNTSQTPIRFSGDGSLATSAYLNAPTGIAVDSSGNLFIADTSNFAIREVVASTGIINTIAGIPPTCSPLGGDGIPAKNAGLCELNESEASISLDGSGNLYIAMPTESRVRKLTPPIATPTTAAAAPVLSVTPGTYPTAQTVTITDTTPGATIYLTLDGSAPGTGLPVAYYKPLNVDGSVTISAIAVAPGYLPSSVTSGAYTITTPPLAAISTIAGSGTRGQSGSGGLALNQQFNNPQGIASDSQGNLYIADTSNQVVWKVVPGTGAISIVAGVQVVPGTGQVLSGIPATSAQLNGPSHVVADPAGNLYISDSLNQVVRRVDAQTGLISTYAGGARFSTVSGDGGPATSAYLASPQGLVLDHAGNLYIADQSHSIVRKVDASSGIITTVAGTYGETSNGIATKQGFAGDGGPATSALLSFPRELALDSQGNLYIVDGSIKRIRVVNATTGIITTFAGNGSAGQSGDGSLATSVEVNPRGFAFDTKDNLYISNWPSTIRMIPAGGGVITTVAGSGYLGLAGDGGSVNLAEMYNVSGLTFDPAGNLYVVDSINQRVRKIIFSSGPAATPQFSVATGTYTSVQTVTITDSTVGATIYYTTDGSTPTTSSTAYTAPVSVSSSETLKAIAVATGFTQSPVASATYTIQLPVAPTITWATPAAITYGTALSSTQLNATASVAGNFVYNPAAGTVLNAGTQTLSATFTPTDTVNYTSTTSTVSLTVAQANTSTALALSNNNLTLTATVTSTASGTPTGTVTFFAGQTQLGTGTLSHGIATYTATSLPAGDVSLSAQYGGDTNFKSSTSTSTLLVAVSPTSTSLTVTSGGSATDVLNVAVPTGYTGTITFTCSGLPQGVTCGFQPSSVTFSGSSTTATTTLTIQTTSRTLAMVPSTPLHNSNRPALATLFGIPGLLALAALGRRRKYSMRLMAVLIVMCGISAGLVGCGGGSSSGGGSGGGTTNPPGTPAGTSTVQVVATGSGGLTLSTNLTLTVQ